MRITYKKQFLKDLKKIPDHTREKIQEIVFTQIPEAQDIHEIKGIKKIKGFSNFYRLRISDYRLGILLDRDKIIFCRILHRKDIYRYFP